MHGRIVGPRGASDRARPARRRTQFQASQQVARVQRAEAEKQADDPLIFFFLLNVHVGRLNMSTVGALLLFVWKNLSDDVSLSLVDSATRIACCSQIRLPWPTSF